MKEFDNERMEAIQKALEIISDKLSEIGRLEEEIEMANDEKEDYEAELCDAKGVLTTYDYKGKDDQYHKDLQEWYNQRN